MCPDYIVADVHYEWEQPELGVHRCRLPFLDVTVGLVAGSTGVLMIDCGTTLTEAHKLEADVSALTGRSVTDIVMTHHHFDHILGSAGFPAARLHAPAPVAAALTTGAALTGAHALRHRARREDVDAALAGLRAPDRVITDAVIDLGDRVVRLVHPGRGHTDHDLIVVVPGRRADERTVVFCGDLVEESGDPAVDGGSDLPAWPQTLDRVLAIGGEDARYVPGHGAVVDAEFVCRQRDWLASRC